MDDGAPDLLGGAVVSATGRSDVRREHDFYETPPAATFALLHHLTRPRAVLDPCCGDGAILGVVRAAWPEVPIVGFDLVARPYALRVRDALAPEPWRPSCDLVLTNPPYKLAQPIVERALLEAGELGTVAMLLRLPFMASRRRVELHTKHPSDVYVLAARPSFTGDGRTDATEYAWFVWGPGRGGRWFVLGG